ncbi:MAG: hypothetical protein RRY55_05160 [Bacteroidales bacterium]
MKFNIKRSLGSMFTSRHDTKIASSLPDVSPLQAPPEGNFSDYGNAFINSDMPVVLLDKITEIINKTIPDIILNTIDKEAEKKEIYEYLHPSFVDYINYISGKIRATGDVVLTDAEIKSKEQREELESKLSCAVQREEDYKGRYLSAERQKRALNDKVKDLEQKIEKYEADKEKAENQRIDQTNKLRLLSQQKNNTEEELERLKLDLDNIKQMHENSSLMHVGSINPESEYIESLKNDIIKLQTENGGIEEKLIASEARVKEITESFETALHVKDETVMQAVEREAILQARIDSLQQEYNEYGEGEDENNEQTRRLIVISRKYQALQRELSNYKVKIYDEVNGEMQRRVEDLTMQLNQTKAKLSQAESNMPDHSLVLDNAHQQIEELRNNLYKSEATSKRLSDELFNANTKTSALNSQVNSLTEAVSASMSIEEQREMRNNLIEVQVEEKSREKELSSALEKIERLQEKLDKQSAASNNKKSGKQIEELKIKLANSEKEAEKLHKEISVSKLNVKALSAEVEMLKADIRKPKSDSIDIIDDDWLVVMEPESEEDILKRRNQEVEIQRQAEAEKDKGIPFEDPAQMKLW